MQSLDFGDSLQIKAHSIDLLTKNEAQKFGLVMTFVGAFGERDSLYFADYFNSEKINHSGVLFTRTRIPYIDWRGDNKEYHSIIVKLDLENESSLQFIKLLVQYFPLPDQRCLPRLSAHEKI